MIDPFSAGCGILTIAFAFKDIAKWLLQYAESLRNAKEDVMKLSNAADLFGSLLELFDTTLKEAKGATDSTLTKEIKKSRIHRHIKRAGRSCYEKLRGVLDLVKALCSGENAGILRKCVAKLKWARHRDVRESVSLEINTVYNSANLLLTIITIDKLVRLIRRLKAAQKEIPQHMVEKIKYLKFDKGNLEIQYKALEARHRTLTSALAGTQGHNPTLKFMRRTSQLVETHIASDPAIAKVLRDRSDDIDRTLEALPPLSPTQAQVENEATASTRVSELDSSTSGLTSPLEPAHIVRRAAQSDGTTESTTSFHIPDNPPSTTSSSYSGATSSSEDLPISISQTHHSSEGDEDSSLEEVVLRSPREGEFYEERRHLRKSRHGARHLYKKDKPRQNESR